MQQFAALELLRQDLADEGITDVNFIAVVMPEYEWTDESLLWADGNPNPVIQDTYDENMTGEWGAEWRDLIIIDAQGNIVDRINLFDYNPDPDTNPDDYQLVKSMVLRAREPAQQEQVTGQIIIRLFRDIAPQTVRRFLGLVRAGFYDGDGDPTKQLTFHRIIDGFMAQGGDPTGTGTGGPGYSFQDEFSPNLRHDKPGILSMANSGPGTNGSQFFITFVPTPHLNDAHSVFGVVTEGMDVVNAIPERDPGSARSPGESIASLTIVES